MIYGLNDAGDLIDESDCASDMIEDGNLPDLLPGERNVLEQLHHSVRDVFQGAKVNALIIAKLAIAHVTMVLDDFTDVLRRQVLHDHQSSTDKITCQLNAPVCPYRRILLYV